MTSPLVSVILPVFNGSKSGLATCLNSIVQQICSDMEIFVIDDCSSDNSVEIINRIMENSHKNYKLIIHSVNQGLSVSLNEGLDLSRGNYILIIQQDCALRSKTELKESIQYMIDGHNTVLVGTPLVDWKNLNRYQKLFKIRISEYFVFKEIHNIVYLSQLKCDLFAREIFSVIGPFDYTHKTVGQDFVMSSKLFLNSVTMYTFDKFTYSIQYEGEKTFRNLCTKEFRYALAVPYVARFWTTSGLFKASKKGQTKNKNRSRFLNLLFPFLLFMTIGVFFLLRSNIIIAFVISLLSAWIFRVLIATKVLSDKKHGLVLIITNILLYIFLDIIYACGFVFGTIYLLKK